VFSGNGVGGEGGGGSFKDEGNQGPGEYIN